MKNHIHPGCVWQYAAAPPLNARLQLLTKDNRVEYGPWKGGPIGENRTYKAWCGLPARDEEVEQHLGYA